MDACTNAVCIAEGGSKSGGLGGRELSPQHLLFLHHQIGILFLSEACCLICAAQLVLQILRPLFRIVGSLLLQSAILIVLSARL